MAGKYLLVFITIWSLTSDPNGSWDHEEYDWKNSLQACEKYAKIKSEAARDTQSRQYLNRLLNLRPSMNLINYDYRCWSEKEVKEYQDARDERLDGDT